MHLDLNDEEQRLFILLGGIIVIATGILIAGQVFRLRIGRTKCDGMLPLGWRSFLFFAVATPGLSFRRPRS